MRNLFVNATSTGIQEENFMFNPIAVTGVAAEAASECACACGFWSGAGSGGGRAGEE
jgi:hypothetical protein